MCNSYGQKNYILFCMRLRTCIYAWLKHISTSKTIDTTNKEILAWKMICRYTAKSHITVTERNETRCQMRPALPSSINISNMLLRMPPPSKIEAGYIFISAKEMLHKTKKLIHSPLKNGKAAANNAKRKLNNIPPNWTSISFLYDIPLESYDKLKWKGPTLIFLILAPTSLAKMICPSSWIM